MEIIMNKPTDFHVISGDDALTFPMMAIGASGVISVINHAFPSTFSGMVNDALEGRWNEAKSKHYQILKASQKIFEDGSPGGIKVMLNQMGLCETHLRAPLFHVNSTLENELRQLVV